MDNQVVWIDWENARNCSWNSLSSSVWNNPNDSFFSISKLFTNSSIYFCCIFVGSGIWLFKITLDIAIAKSGPWIPSSWHIEKGKCIYGSIHYLNASNVLINPFLILFAKLINSFSGRIS